jgi:hypothetical protein
VDHDVARRDRDDHGAPGGGHPIDCAARARRDRRLRAIFR